MWALHIHEFHINGFNQPQIKGFFGKKKNSCKLQKVKLEFAAESNYLHNIYTILGITSNLEMILSIGRMCIVYMQILFYLI